MSRIVFALLLATAWLDAHAQSSLPPCPGDYKTTTWTNCFGTYTYYNGDKYVGAWRDGNRNGQGIEYNAFGTVRLSGLWANNTLSQAYAIDTNRFSLNAVSAVATAADSGDEIFRLKRDLAAAKKRIKLLESELARAREASKSPSAESGLSLVTKCLKAGLQPGTPEFSKCVASQGGVP